LLEHLGIFEACLIEVEKLKNLYPEMIKDKLTQKMAEKLKDFKIDETPCSKQCCNHVQWPIPFNTKNPNLDKSVEVDYIPNNLSCNRGGSGGCVCLTKDQFNYLSNHGQSA
jgi:hypothetical protein